MGYDVIGRALKAGVLTQAERSQAVRRCMEDPAYEQRLEEQIAAAGTATSAARGRSTGAMVAASGPAAELLRAWTGGDSTYREILAAGIPMPELFPGGPAGGTLPNSTASGMDPQRLAAAKKWWTRPAIAEAANLPEAEELLAEALNDPALLEASDRAFSSAAGYADFETGVRAAMMAAGRAKVERDADAQIAAARQARVSASSAKSPQDMTEDEIYAAAYGEGDRLREALRASPRRGVEVRNYWDGTPRR